MIQSIIQLKIDKSCNLSFNQSAYQLRKQIMKSESQSINLITELMFNGWMGWNNKGRMNGWNWLPTHTAATDKS